MKLNAIKDQLGRAVINISNNAKAFGISGNWEKACINIIILIIE